MQHLENQPRVCWPSYTSWYTLALRVRQIEKIAKAGINLLKPNDAYKRRKLAIIVSDNGLSPGLNLNQC